MKDAGAALTAAKAKMENTTKQTASKAKAGSNDKAQSSDKQQSKVKLGDDGFKIQQGVAHQNRMKLKAAEYRVIFYGKVIGPKYHIV